ncbi:MAG: hypothetical protein U1E76_04925 [Planctomycetota bacterium]
MTKVVRKSISHDLVCEPLPPDHAANAGVGDQQVRDRTDHGECQDREDRLKRELHSAASGHRADDGGHIRRDQEDDGYG